MASLRRTTSELGAWYLRQTPVEGSSSALQSSLQEERLWTLSGRLGDSSGMESLSSPLGLLLISDRTPRVKY